MGARVLRDFFMACMVVGACIMAFTQREAIYNYIGIHPADLAAAQQKAADEAQAKKEAEEPAEIAEIATTPSSGVAHIRKSPDGQFWAHALVNHAQVKLLVDTGASVVALTPEDARKAGIDMRALKYVVPINTANGQVMAASAQLKQVKVGGVGVRNVRAVVIPKGLSHSLLGMSYLGQLQKVEATRSALILRR